MQQPQNGKKTNGKYTKNTSLKKSNILVLQNSKEPRLKLRKYY